MVAVHFCTEGTTEDFPASCACRNSENGGRVLMSSLCLFGRVMVKVPVLLEEGQLTHREY